MRELLSLFVAAGLALSLGACEEQPTTVDQQVQANQGQGPDAVVNSDLRAVDTEAAELNDFEPGQHVGNIQVKDDQKNNELTVSGNARQLSAATFYVSLFYDVESTVRGPEACEPAVFDEEDPNFLTAAQMEAGFWSVNEGGKGTLIDFGEPPREYVTVDKIGTVSIRDVRVADADIDGDGKPDPGAGPEAVVACGKVVKESTRASD